MVTDNRVENKPTRIRIITAEDSPLELSSLSSFLYDLVIVHDRLLMLSSNEYPIPRSGSYFYSRKRGSIKEKDRLQVTRITKESPTAIELMLPYAAYAATLTTFSLTFIRILQFFADRKEDRANKALDTQIKQAQLRKLLQDELDRALLANRLDSAERNEDTFQEDIKRRLPENPSISSKQTEGALTKDNGHNLSPYQESSVQQAEEDLMKDIMRLGSNKQIKIKRVETIEISIEDKNSPDKG
jgi:hypothetical protein